jgi:hypothetical protein
VETQDKLLYLLATLCIVCNQFSRHSSLLWWCSYKACVADLIHSKNLFIIKCSWWCKSRNNLLQGKEYRSNIYKHILLLKQIKLFTSAHGTFAE